MTKHILNNDGKTLQAILARVDELKQLNTQIAEHLEPLLAKHCQAVNIDKGCLIVLVDNGHWATQLRFQIPNLLSKLRTHPPLQNLKGIICKTRPDYSPASPQKQPKRMSLSQQTAEIILESAQTISDKSLHDILEKIAKHLRIP